MGVVSVRIADEDEAVLRRAKVNMSAVVRKAIHEEARRLVQTEALQYLDDARRKSKPAKTRGEDLVREMRDAD